MWEFVRSTVTHPLVAGPLGGAIVAFLAYVDAKFREIDRERFTYWKLFIVSSLVIAILIYLVSEEFTKTDEFLNQEYETELAGSLMPSKKGGFEIQNPYQPELRGPSENITAMMDGLPSSSTTEIFSKDTPSMPSSIFPSQQVSMKTRRVGGSHRSHRSNQPSRHSGRSHRSGRR